MHPILTHRERLLFYVGAWCALGMLLVPVFAPARLTWGDAGLFLFIPLLLYALVSLSAWYLCRSLPAQTTPPSRILTVGVLSGAVASAFFLVVSLGWAWVLRSVLDRPIALATSDVRILATAGVLLYVLALVFHYLLAAVEDSRISERRSFESQLLARDSELKALRAQIDPHFLFNSLNSISALTTTDPLRARAMTVELAEFFRTSVAAGRKEWVLLSDELQLARRFLEIERIRFGDRLRVIVEDDSQALSCRMPPLILQPLVENAVKHGVASAINGGTVSIRTSKDGAFVTVEISNPVEADETVADRRGASFGLNSVRERLRVATRDRADISVDRTPTAHVVRLRIPGDL